MISTLEKEITFRFLKARKKDGFLNVISIFSFIGISLGVAVLIIVMSVMNGFRTELTNKIVGFNPHITVKSYDDKGINRNKLDNNNLKLITKNLIFSNSGEAIILKNNTSKGIVLRGYQTKEFSNLTIIKNDKFKGDKSKLDKNSISIGNELSFSLGLKIKDNIEAIIDDTDENYSSKIKKMNLIGAPYQIVIGKKSEGDLLEFKVTGGETQNLSLNKIIEIITKQKVAN